MRLRVQFYAQLRDLAGNSEMDVEMPEKLDRPRSSGKSL